jgi:formate hydrogenlyase subunit 3/multisubunit Na+/H+ antiporter MnhD subunit
MSPQTAPAIPISAVVALVLGGAVVVVCTSLALRRKTAANALAWLSMAGLGQVVLALGAALALPGGDGARAAALQFLVIGMAAALAALCGSDKAEGEDVRPRLPGAAVVTALLLLLGLPPAAGFHAKVALWHSLLQPGWIGMAALVLAASAASVLPALWALDALPRARLGLVRSILVVALMAAAVAIGLYPQLGLDAAAWVARVLLRA